MSDLSGMSVTYAQDPDSNDSGLGQELRLEVEDAGGGPFLVIKTERWAVDFKQIPELFARIRLLARLAEREWKKDHEASKQPG